MTEAPWSVHCDGSSMPNPGRMGLGAVITAPDGTRQTLSIAPQATGCNNEAELRALIVALDRVIACGGRDVVAYTDSRVLLDQLEGPPPKPIARLADVFDQARAALELFDKAQLRWIPGHRNAEADALARAALGMPARAALKAKHR